MKETLERWLHEQSAFTGLLARGIRLPDQQTVGQSFAEDYTLEAIGNLCRGAADTFRVLGMHQLPCRDLRWTYSAGIVGAIRRPDGVVFVYVLQPDLAPDGWETIDCQRQTFMNGESSRSPETRA